MKRRRSAQRHPDCAEQLVWKMDAVHFWLTLAVEPWEETGGVCHGVLKEGQETVDRGGTQVETRR